MLLLITYLKRFKILNECKLIHLAYITSITIKYNKLLSMVCHNIKLQSTFKTSLSYCFDNV